MATPGWLGARCRVSLKFDCGCTLPPGAEPVRAFEAINVGIVRECPKHGERVIVRVTQYLVVGPDDTPWTKVQAW